MFEDSVKDCVLCVSGTFLAWKIWRILHFCRQCDECILAIYTQCQFCSPVSLHYRHDSTRDTVEWQPVSKTAHCKCNSLVRWGSLRKCTNSFSHGTRILFRKRTWRGYCTHLWKNDIFGRARREGPWNKNNETKRTWNMDEWNPKTRGILSGEKFSQTECDGTSHDVICRILIQFD